MFTGEHVSALSSLDGEIEIRAKELLEEWKDSFTAADHIKEIEEIADMKQLSNDDWISLMRLAGRTI